MYTTGQILKVPVLVIKDETSAGKEYRTGIVIGASQTVEDATELRVETGEGRYVIANIKNSELAEAN